MSVRTARPAAPAADAADAVEQAARAFASRAAAGSATPLGLGAWREVSRSGDLPGDPAPDATAAGLVRRWHQHLAVAIDLPMEREAPGAERLPALLTAWLDLARRTEAVRRHVARTAGPVTVAEQGRQTALLAGLLAEDLDALGAPCPQRSAVDLLRELALVAAAEDERGGVDRAARATLLGAAGVPLPPPVTAPLRRLLRRALHPALA